MLKTFQQLVSLILSTLVLAAIASADEAIRTPEKLDLQTCIRIALATAPELGEAQADLAFTGSKLQEAKAYRYPQISVMSLLGPAPGARREDIYPTIATDSTFKFGNLTWFTSADLLVTQPLWTFGKISESMKAATHGMEVDKAKKLQKGNEVTLEVKKYFYGILLARELQNVISELQNYLEQGKEKVQQLIEIESASGDPMDLNKIDAYAGEINKYMEEARKGEQLALAALRARLGMPEGTHLALAADRLEVPDELLPQLPEILGKARQQRPEFKQLAEGMAARTSLVEAAKASYYPDIFLAGMFSWAYADNRDRIHNPYITDTFKHAYGGIALGLKWQLDFGITGARVAGEQAQLDRLASTKSYADNYIPLQVQKAWLELQEAHNNITITKKAFQSAKKWGAAELANFDFGIGNPRDVFESVGIYGKMKAAHYQAIYDYYLAKANLEYAIGESPLAR